MAQWTGRTITEDLYLYRELRRKHGDWENERIAEEMGLGFEAKARISHYATYWYLVDDGRLAPQLIRVIRVHNNLKDARYGEKKRLFTLDKVYKGLSFRQGPLPFTVEQQTAALQKTLESVKRERPTWIPFDVKTIDECSDRDLESLDWHKFKRHLTMPSE